MSNNLSGYTLRLNAAVDLVTETCCNCHVLFAMTADQYAQLQANPRTRFYCPNGHEQWYVGDSDAAKLRRAEARETALRDQLEASIRDADAARAAHLRDRQRIANGVCPCCTRSFQNLRRHMADQHPEYAAPAPHAGPLFGCSCGLDFPTFRGLRIHQGKVRGTDWAKPGQPKWRSHLTVGASR